jgi:DNA-binding winged helix-turn-helix (wHTH) protein
MELRKHGVPIRLQEQPFRVLAMLAERPGEVITREEFKSRSGETLSSISTSP